MTDIRNTAIRPGAIHYGDPMPLQNNRAPAHISSKDSTMTKASSTLTPNANEVADLFGFDGNPAQDPAGFVRGLTAAVKGWLDAFSTGQSQQAPELAPEFAPTKALNASQRAAVQRLADHLNSGRMTEATFLKEVARAASPIAPAPPPRRTTYTSAVARLTERERKGLSKNGKPVTEAAAAKYLETKAAMAARAIRTGS